MLFEVVRAADNRPMMSTEYESCIPYEHLTAMSKSGYYFRLDGKKVNANAVRLLQKGNKEMDFILPNCHVTEENMPDSNNMKVAYKPSTSSKSVRCVDTGEIFKNQAEAARHFKIDPAQVSDSIKTGRPRSGYTFEKVAN